MKKKIIIATCSIILLTGCGDAKVRDNSIIDEVTIMHENEGVLDKQMDTVKKLQVVDTYDDIYAEQLDINISEDYIAKLQMAYEKAEKSDNLILREPLYSIQFITSDGSIADTWIIDDYRTIKTSNGILILRDGNLDEVLSEMEKEYSIGYSLLERQPGEQYLSSITRTDRVEFRKLNQLSLDTPIEYSLSKDKIDDIKANWKKIIISNAASKDYKVIYTLCFLNADGNELQTLHIDDKNKMYTSYGYELTGDYIMKWVNSVMEEALNQ